MAISTFAELKAAVADFLNRDDLTAAVPNFVALAEAGFNRVIRSHRMIERGALTIDAQYEALPADWLETIGITIAANPTRPLTQLGDDDMARYRMQADDVAGVPVYFAHNGTDVEIFPTPDQSYTGQITYFQKITALSADGDTNWLLTNHPDVYLHGSLMHSAPYLKDDPRLAVWAGLLSQGLGEIEAETRGARFGSPLRMRMR